MILLFKSWISLKTLGSWWKVIIFFSISLDLPKSVFLVISRLSYRVTILRECLLTSRTQKIKNSGKSKLLLWFSSCRFLIFSTSFPTFLSCFWLRRNVWFLFWDWFLCRGWFFERRFLFNNHFCCKWESVHYRIVRKIVANDGKRKHSKFSTNEINIHVKYQINVIISWYWEIVSTVNENMMTCSTEGFVQPNVRLQYLSHHIQDHIQEPC